MIRRTGLRRSGFLSRRTRIRPISYRHKRRLDEYYDKRLVFLARPENKWCPVAWTLWGKQIRTTDVHHKRGRIGTLLLDETYWLAVSREGHTWVHEHPAEARAHGWLGS